MKQILKARTLGMITDPREGDLRDRGWGGGYGLSGFRERSEIADSIGLSMVNIELTLGTAQRVREGGMLDVQRWNGTSMESMLLPAHLLRVVYDYSGEMVTTTPEYQATIPAMVDTGKRFINSPSVISICTNKWNSQLLFDELGIPTPTTSEYSRDNVRAMLSEFGFVFIKQAVGEAGKGQLTVRLQNGKFNVKLDKDENLFSDFNEAMDFVEGNLEGKCIVQEGIKMPNVLGRVYDLRGIFQMTPSGIVMPSTFVRVGAQNRDQANTNQGGQIQDAEVFFPNFPQIRANMFEIGTSIFEGLRRHGDITDIGIDFLNPSEDKLMVAEVNEKCGVVVSLSERQRIDLSLTLRDGYQGITEDQMIEKWKGIFNTVVTNPLAWAKHLIDEEEKRST